MLRRSSATRFVELRLQLRDIGTPGSPASPSTLNAVTITRLASGAVQSDGRNYGTDVPYELRQCSNVHGAADGSGQRGFHDRAVAGQREAPLAPLVDNDTIISTIAYVTFYGHDQTGNEVSVTGTIDVTLATLEIPRKTAMMITIDFLAWTAAGHAAIAVLSSGCTVQEQEMPGLAGPSELGLGMSLTAAPEFLPRDGSSISRLRPEHRFDSNAAPKPNQRLYHRHQRWYASLPARS